MTFHDTFVPALISKLQPRSWQDPVNSSGEDGQHEVVADLVGKERPLEVQQTEEHLRRTTLENQTLVLQSEETKSNFLPAKRKNSVLGYFRRSRSTSSKVSQEKAEFVVRDSVVTVPDVTGLEPKNDTRTLSTETRELKKVRRAWSGHWSRKYRKYKFEPGASSEEASHLSHLNTQLCEISDEKEPSAISKGRYCAEQLSFDPSKDKAINTSEKVSVWLDHCEQALEGRPGIHLFNHHYHSVLFQKVKGYEPPRRQHYPGTASVDFSDYSSTPRGQAERKLRLDTQEVLNVHRREYEIPRRSNNVQLYLMGCTRGTPRSDKLRPSLPIRG